MELTEKVESINKQLINLYGIDTISGQPIWRVVWSEDQLEKRMMDVTNEGFQLLTPEVRLVPKYRQWIQEKWVLEQLTIVPDVNLKELAGEKLSYEPKWVFETNEGKYLPPRLDAAKFVIDTMYAAMGKSSIRKYADPDSNKEEAVHNKQQRVEKIVNELFGNETETGDALAHKQAITVPRNYGDN